MLLIWSPLTTSVTSIQSSAVVQATKQHFGRHGIPRTLLMDNGSQYTSDLFKEFTKAYKFDHITSLLVTIQIWTSCKVSQTTSFVQLMMWTWHSCQCITLHLAGHTFSLAERLFGHVLCSNLPQPITFCFCCSFVVVSDHLHRKLQQKQNYDKHTRPLHLYYPPGSYVQASP